MDTTNQPEQKQIRFNNNPFSLAFSSMSQAFKINQNPAVTIIIGGIVIGVANQIVGYIPDLLRIFIDESNDGAVLAFGVFSMVFALGVMVVSVVVSTLWTGFLAYVGVQNAKTNRVTVSEGLRAGLRKFWSILAINILIGLLALACLMPALVVLIVGAVLTGLDQREVGVGLFIASALLFFAGLFFAARLSFARSLSVYALLDEGAGVFGSMSRSVALTKNRLIEVWGMAFPGAIIPIVSGLLGACGMGAHYLQLKVYRDHSVELPKVHILSWLPLMLIGGVFVLVVVIGALVSALSFS